MKNSDSHISPEAQTQLRAVAASLLTQRYIEPELAEQAAELLMKKNSDMRDITPQEFCDRTNALLWEILRDKHCVCKIKKSPEEREQAKIRHNFGITEVSVSDGLGYVKMNAFSGDKRAASILLNALQFLRYTSSLIVDVRGNKGGAPDLVQLLMTALLPQHPTHINSFSVRKGDRQELVHFYTYSDSAVAALLAEMPLAVLCDAHTFSAAEEFCYNVQVAKRGVLIGEMTAGAAQPGAWHSINERIDLYIPSARAVNPLTGTNWEKTGVKPDVLCSSENSLIAAKKLLKTVP